ncbi:MAG: CBS domain-containing protein [Alphaproteobacteria bacterium GM202ARS2]|nr:CBS domain-containing protein [Alphaproteobacteria bacterium GM202ARS2]
MQRKIIPDVVAPSNVHAITAQESALRAAQLMDDKNISALVVLDSNKMLQGIITERDILRKVTAQKKDPEKVLIKTIMTPNPQCLGKDDIAMDALTIFSQGHFRHLPVTENGKVLAVVSIRDIFKVCKTQMDEDLKQRDQLLHGTGYGGL